MNHLCSNKASSSYCIKGLTECLSYGHIKAFNTRFLCRKQAYVDTFKKEIVDSEAIALTSIRKS